MRTIENGNSLAHVTGIQVLVHNGTDWIDLCNPAGSSFPGKSRVSSLSFSASRDRGGYTGTLRLINGPYFREANESLDPGHTSMFNPGGIPLLGAYHSVRILLGKGGADPVLVFQGYVGPDEVRSGEDVEGKDYIEVGLVGVMQPYADYYIDKRDGLVYTETYISNAVERDMLNQILVDYGFAEAIVIQDDPNYYVHRYQIGDISLLEALERPVQAIGFCLEERYHAASDSFRPTVVDPMRTNSTPDLSLGGNIKATRLAYTEANIRTWVRVVYRDRTTGKEAFVDAKDESARAIYGIPDGQGGRKHRYMRIVEKEGSLIDTPAEAVDEADMALHDVSAPCPAVEATIPWLVLGVELGDLVQIETPSETITVGVTDITWNLPEYDTLGSTVIRGAANRRVGARRYWFDRSRTDWAGKVDRDLDEAHGPLPGAPTYVEAEGLWGEDESGTPAPVLHVRWRW